MPTTKKIISQLMQQNFVVEDPYQMILIKFLFMSLCVSINYMDTYINVLGNNFEWRYCAYQYNTKKV